ncbi:MAG: 4-hydroxy-tetrahydrodipicolinate reductase [Desulfovibrio sp.]|jgi:4-hydroxy-tetrahydrodipicolinate reductase|nr:4-hydroxy-tetrahydrodipicolinate reductase [Desulfovibrio sp.]
MNAQDTTPDNVPIIIVGAAGRMGSTIRGLVTAGEGFSLAGLVDRPEFRAGLETFGVPVADRLDALLPKVQGVVVDFTAPEVSLASARAVAATGHSLVVGTTGLSPEQREELAALAKRAPIFWSSNMSVGVNVLLKMLPALARTLGDAYDIEIVEIHHGRKKDSPSGTALTLGECLAGAREWNLPDVRCSGRNGIIGERPKLQIGVQAVRGGDVTGIHTVYFLGPGERIEVSHHAHSRENFAQGALRAARWMCGRAPGRLHSMQDCLEG